MLGSVGVGSLEAFSAVRSGCPALSHIFVPDEVWPDFQKWHQQPDDVAYHRSILLLAMERAHLNRVTSAVHRYLINAGVPRSDVRRQYLRDLQERWMYYPDALQRHQKFRIFFGRLTELQCAEQLESEGWTISGLEALRQGPDIEAYTGNQHSTAFEVKFIGTEDADFAVLLKSLTGWPAATTVSPYAAANYVLFRAYEAAKQLQRVTCGRIAMLVVDELTWWRFEIPLRRNWIDWASPTFFTNDSNWERFLATKLTQYPTITTDLQPALQSLDAIWILKRSDDYQYHREIEIPVK